MSGASPFERRCLCPDCTGLKSWTISAESTAGMYDERGIGDVLDRTTQHTPETRFVPVGHAVKARISMGWALCTNHSIVPMFCQNKPTPRLVAPGIDAQPLHDETLGRALDTLSAAGVTARYRLMAVMAAHRLGLTPTCAHLESPSFHVDGRDNSGGSLTPRSFSSREATAAIIGLT